MNESQEPSESTSSSHGDVPHTFRSRLLMSCQSSALVVVDVQEKLVRLVEQADTMVWNIKRLIAGADVLGVSVDLTEQYPQGLGHTIPELAEKIEYGHEKIMFSCRECQGLLDRLRKQGRTQVLLVGIETHVCVQQTAYDFLAMGFDVWVAVDAVSSRNEVDRCTALRRMELAGITLTTTEAALFEWCEVAGSPEFKQISQIVRQPCPKVTSE